jgi:hypothetical protein
MGNLNHYVGLYKAQLQKGDIQQAYVALTKYVTKLRTTLSNKLAEQYEFGSIFQGYMDYTYFYYSNDFLKKRKLKMALVLNHYEMQFEVWLLGQTIPIQEKYWEFLKTTKWNEHRTSRPQYAVIVAPLIENPDFDDLEVLSELILEKLVSLSDEIINAVKTKAV